MSTIGIRRAAALGLMLALAASGIAAADTVVADGDAIATGTQTMLDLGDVAPGATVPVDVAFVLTCKDTSHVASSSKIAILVSDQSWPEDGTATWTPGQITVGAWPADGADCPDPVPSTVGDTPVHLALTAPTVVGNGFTFDFLFVADPDTGVTNTLAFTAMMNVVEPGPTGTPPDTTAPVMAGLPADITVFTSGTSAVVTWTMPTATDDTDPDPVVACDPTSGSSFALGTTTVTCTATDASGNASQGSFDVNVSVAVRQLTGTWGPPLDGGSVLALVGQLGRTIPLKLQVNAGDAALGPGAIDAPELTLDRLGTCATDAPTLATRAGGTFAWNDGAWQLNLRTADLSAGCWRLSATVNASPLATAVVLLTADATAQGLTRATSQRATSHRATSHRATSHRATSKRRVR